MTAPSNVFEVVQNTEQFSLNLDNVDGPIGILSTTNPDTLSRYIVQSDSSNLQFGVVGPSYSGAIGVGSPSDGYIYSNSVSNGLNIISQPGTGTEDYIRLYAGGNPQTSTAHIHIHGSGSTKGYVGIGTENPSARLHIFDSTGNTVLRLESGDPRVNLRLQDSLASNFPLVGADSDILTFGHISGGDKMIITPTGDVGIGELFAPTIANGKPNPEARLHVVGASANSTVFRVDGVSGELFKVTDSLTGSLMSVNDISGLPILEVFDDNTIIMGDYQSPSMYSSKKSVVDIVTNFVVYQFDASLYNSVFFEYNVKNSNNLRAGTIMAVFDSTSIEFTETSTADIGSTTSVSFNVVLTTIGSTTYVQLRATTTTSGWTIKSIIRTI